jgi:hypothetical protein
VVHALKRIHRSLRTDGFVLDLHPEPVNPGVEVWLDGKVERLGHVDQEEDLIEILEARALLDLVESEGWYGTKRRRFFDLVGHFPSPDAWLEYQEREGYTGTLPEAVLAEARRMLAPGGGAFVVREPIRASLLRRCPRPGGSEPTAHLHRDS